MRKISFRETRKIIGRKRSCLCSSEFGSNQDNKYRVLEEKLIHLEPNEGSKFQEHLKKLHSAEFHQAQTQKQEVTNKEISIEVVKKRKKHT